MTGICTCGETRPLIEGRCARCRCSCQQEPPCESCFNEAELIAERDHYRQALEEIAERCGDDSRPQDNPVQMARAALNQNGHTEG